MSSIIQSRSNNCDNRVADDTFMCHSGDVHQTSTEQGGNQNKTGTHFALERNHGRIRTA